MSFCSPPCSSYSTIGNLQLDSTYDGQLLRKHLEHVVQHVRSLAHNVETVGNAVQVDDGRIRELLRQAGEQAGYKMFCECVTPIDHGGVQDRPQCQLIFVRDDVVDLCGDFKYPASTTPTVLPRLRDYLDPIDEVQWDRLRSDADYVPGVHSHKHEHGYRGVLQNFTTGALGLASRRTVSMVRLESSRASTHPIMVDVRVCTTMIASQRRRGTPIIADCLLVKPPGSLTSPRLPRSTALTMNSWTE